MVLNCILLCFNLLVDDSLVDCVDEICECLDEVQEVVCFVQQFGN